MTTRGPDYMGDGTPGDRAERWMRANFASGDKLRTVAALNLMLSLRWNREAPSEKAAADLGRCLARAERLDDDSQQHEE